MFLSGATASDSVPPLTDMPRRARTAVRSTSSEKELCGVSASKPAPPPVLNALNTKKMNRYCATATTKPNSPESTNSATKLDELKLAFCLLARKIQGVDGDGDESGVLCCPPAVSSFHDDGKAAAGSARGGVEGGGIVSKSCPTTKNKGGVVGKTMDSSRHTQRACLPATNDNVVRPTHSKNKGTKDGAVVFRAAKDPVPKKVQTISRDEPELQQREADRLKRIKAAAYAEGRSAAEAAARGAKQALKRLHAELEAEKRSREAAESAFQELQLRSAEATLEREKLARVVTSFGGRSLEELTVDSKRLERRAREAEAALTESRNLADAKASEALEALERAADLGEALEKERAARAVAEDARKKVTQDLRACLRGRAKAEEGASAASRALQKSEEHTESLTRRLEVLRAANRRLDKRVSSAADGVGVGGHRASATNTNTDDRLAAARARLRALSACNLNSTGGGVGCSGRIENDETAAIERAMKAAVNEKKWHEKLLQAEMQGETYKSAAQAAETGMRTIAREKAELEEVNRILAKKLAEAPDSGLINDATGGEGINAVSPIAVARVGDAASTGAQNSSLVSDDGKVCVVQLDVHTLSRGNSSSDTREGTRPDVCGVSSPESRPWELAGTGDAAAAVTGAVRARFSHAHMADLLRATDSMLVKGSGGQQATTFHGEEVAHEGKRRGFSRQSARSNSVDESGSRSPSDRFRHHVRPRSVSEASPLDRRDAPQTARGQGAGDNNDSAAPYDQLLSDSRRLRKEVLLAVRNGPWREGAQFGLAAHTPSPSPQGQEAQPSGVQHEVSQFVDDAGVRLDNNDNTVASVPIEVLLRLCGRSSRCGRGDQGDITDTGGRRDISSQVVVEEGKTEKGGGPASLGRRSWTESASGMDSGELPPGISVALAQQVQSAVSRGDERGFLKIVGQCGSTERGGIAQLLSVNAPE